MRIPQIIGGLLVTSLLGFGGWLAFDVYSARRTEETLRTELARLLEEEPAARVRCDAIEPAGEGREARMHLRWAPLGPDGRLLEGAEVKSFELEGRIAYFDAYQIIFEDDLVREGDPLRGRTLTLFARAFGDAQAPREGFPLDVPEAVAREGPSEASPDLVPTRYRQATDGRAAAVESRLWSRFWQLCLDPEYARSQGVRTAQGTAASAPMVAGREYTLTLKRDGQVILKAAEASLFDEE